MLYVLVHAILTIVELSLDNDAQASVIGLADVLASASVSSSTGVLGANRKTYRCLENTGSPSHGPTYF